MRRLVAVPVILAVGGLFGGCGKSQPAPAVTVVKSAGTPGAATTTHHAKARPAKPSPQVSPARARALAFARAVNLTANDLPGFSASSEHEAKHEDATEKRATQELHACAGESGAHPELAEVSSKSFERKAGIASQSVSSSVTVESTAAAAAELPKALHSG